MQLRFRSANTTAAIYTAPISERGWLTAWKGKHSRWNHGFIVRVLWFGFVFRWGYRHHVYFDPFDACLDENVGPH